MAITKEQLEKAINLIQQGVPKDPEEQQKLFEEVFGKSSIEPKDSNCPVCAACAQCGPTWVAGFGAAILKSFG